MLEPVKSRSPQAAEYRGVTEPMAPALMRANHEWAVARIIEHLHAAGFTDIRTSHTPVIAFPGPHGARPSEIAARTGRSKQHINILLGELEAAGYLERRPEGADQRAKLIQLTDRGMDLAAAVKDAVEHVEAHWQQILGERRMAELKNSLQRLRAAATPQEPPPSSVVVARDDHDTATSTGRSTRSPAPDPTAGGIGVRRKPKR